MTISHETECRAAGGRGTRRHGAQCLRKILPNSYKLHKIKEAFLQILCNGETKQRRTKQKMQYNIIKKQ